jgi:hypothetical protein
MAAAAAATAGYLVREDLVKVSKMLLVKVVKVFVL